MTKEKRMEKALLEIVYYKSAHQSAFEKLNRNWIEKYFWMEAIDEQVLQHPETHILNNGGAILMALYQQEVAGTVALKYVEPGVFEFTKMAVEESHQGKKIGEALALTAIQTAKERGAKKIILYSNTKLHKAIMLYRKLGFKEVALDGPYKRSDIKMELIPG
jgi:GNAT superfamily N-acetyltransferase